MENRAYQTFSFPSATGTGQISGRLFPADGSGNVCIQIVHGMAEHQERYYQLSLYLAGLGYTVISHDHAGHGQSAQSTADLGYFGDKNGARDVLDDVEKAYQTGLGLFKDRCRQRIILGHSMGSFIARDFLSREGVKVDGLILSGTAGPNPLLPLGLSLARLIILFRGTRYRSKLLERVISAGNLKRIRQKRTKFDWLTRENQTVDDYLEDPLCGFCLTAAGYRDLLLWLKRVSAPGWPATLPQACPVLIIAGEQDPVGNYGAGPRLIGERLKAQGLETTVRLYSEGRHEILNELNRLTVWQDLYTWLEDNKFHER